MTDFADDLPSDDVTPGDDPVADAAGADAAGDGDAVVDPGDVTAEDTGDDAATEDDLPGVAAEAGSSDAIEVLDAEDLLDEQAEVDDDEDDEVVPVESPYDRPGQWFVVHTYAGYENKVKQNLQSRIQSMNMEDRIYEVVIPMEDVAEFKGGKRVVVQKKVFPGYLLVRCQLDDDAWYVVRNTPGVTGFVGLGAKPTPLSRKEVESILQVPVEGTEAPKKTRPRLEFDLEESVRVREGPFADFNGTISEIDEDRLKVKVLVNIFGRETPVELDFNQIAKL